MDPVNINIFESDDEDFEEGISRLRHPKTFRIRYNFERLCNGLKRVERLLDWKKVITEAYFPKLDSLIASRTWPARVANEKLSDLKREADQIVQDVADLERWRDRIFDAIHNGRAMRRDGSFVNLTENEGIDILGNIVESSILSPNREFYGDLHNMGHVFIAFIHDPDNRHLESFGVMGDTATAMRDPIFYRWHGFIDNIFQQFKSTLPRYTIDQLNYSGVTIESVSIESETGTNTLNTFWQQSDVDLSRGMDFQPRGPVLVRFTHLNHQPFNYRIIVDNNGAVRQGTCRIFMAPKYDESGRPWLFRDQRSLFIELDRFRVDLRQGQNTITRASTESTVTIPFERSFRDLNANRPQGGDDLAQFNFCGCGWPQHMLIPKGNTDDPGFRCELFVMISNYEGDKINQDTSGVCNDADVFCGVKDKLYPDRRSMGYPFDRQPRRGVDNLQQFLTPNMRVQDVAIKFSNRTFKPRQNN
ncbi:unnamed protein product [Diabrotica balteata]|uniref:Tyrosinase copper-binding domain-containing protein n=1 Tax=Diabrotica balteata TaxID=107213 RepID=A0A9P0H0I4_DIABA|nr:unnamed protein product [Diabrotica balteata]